MVGGGALVLALGQVSDELMAESVITRTNSLLVVWPLRECENASSASRWIKFGFSAGLWTANDFHLRISLYMRMLFE